MYNCLCFTPTRSDLRIPLLRSPISNRLNVGLRHHISRFWAPSIRTIPEWLELFLNSMHLECWNQKNSHVGTVNGNWTKARNENNGFIYYAFNYTHYTGTENRTGGQWVAYPFPQSPFRSWFRAICMSHKECFWIKRQRFNINNLDNFQRPFGNIN